LKLKNNLFFMSLNCVFCQIVNKQIDSWTIYEDERAQVFLDINPASLGHVLIIPKKHFENIYDIPQDELSYLIKIVQKIALAYRQFLGVDNVQILHSAGKDAQQEVPHFHFHLIPRKKGDDLNLSYPPRPELKENFEF